MQAGADVTYAELRGRVRRVAAELRRRDLDALLVWGRGGATLERHGEVLWLTSFYNPWLAVTDSEEWAGQALCAALVTAEAEVVLVTNIPRSEWAHQRVLCDGWTDDPFIAASAARAVRDRGLTAARVGLAGRAALTVDVWTDLHEAVPEVRWSPADDVVPSLWEVRSPAELRYVRGAAAAADAQLRAICERLTDGASELAVLAAGTAACVRAGATPYGTFLADGPRESRMTPASPPDGDDRTLRAGELWRLDTIGAYRGYLFDVARSTVIGGPDARQEEVLEAPIAVVDAVIAALEPGRPVCEAYEAGAATMRRVAPWAAPPGKHDFAHLGHTIGAGWGHVWITGRERRPVEPGMVLAVEAVVAHPEVGAPMYEQNLVVGEDGVEVLTSAPSRPWRA